MNAARRFGIRYLWIDCYCILQPENEEDNGDEAKREWHAEALQVRDVYKNAIINFGAAYARNPFEGSFTTREPKPTFEYCEHDSHPESLYRILRMDSSRRFEAQDHFNEHALMSRGWVLQERILSPRMLSFGKHQIYWECLGVPGKLACETFPDGITHEQTGIHDFSLTEQRWDEVSIRAPIEWTKLLDQYSRLDLSFPTKDKLTALAGIAEEYANLVNDDYIAGFFRKDLLRLLRWNVSAISSRARIWRAPTWSWASMDGPVFWLSDCTNEDILIAVEDINLELLHPGMKYGPLRSGFITLKGPLMKVMIQAAAITRRSHNEKLQSTKFQGNELEMDFDDVQESQSVGSMLTLLATSKRYHGLMGLILQHDETTSVYRRLGVWYASGPYHQDPVGLLQSAEISMVTIE
ncbi:MAG: hypothetical protein M1821_010040 [Bathelium mastoideum]|nr:MAG: hypothetical protein M1821_010040 [Bathelium mastoideum]